MASGYSKYSGMGGGGGGGSGTVTSVGLADASSTPIFTITNSPVTTTGTLTETLIAQVANTVFSGPASGGNAQPTFRALVGLDIPVDNSTLDVSAGKIEVKASGITSTQIATSAIGSGLGGGAGTAINIGTADNSISVGAHSISVNRATGGALSATSGLAVNVDGVTITINGSNQLVGAASGITALTGDVTASGTGSVTATLAAVNTNTGSFGSSTSIPNFSVNGKGLITAAGGNAVIAPAGTLSGTTLNSAVVTSSLTSLGTQSQILNMGSFNINAVADPTTAQQAATKNYVDTVASGLNPLQAVTAATTANIAGTYVQVGGGIGDTFTTTSTSAFTVDGQSPAVTSRVLFKNQTSGQQNGIYNLTTQATGIVGAIFTRSLDYDTVSDINAGDLIPVINGTVNANTSWLQTATVTSVGTSGTPLVFAQWTANPANYLLKANNLSDVSSAATAYNNITPMTTTGDIPYEVSAGIAGRLAIGTANQVLQVNAGATAPVWASGTTLGYFSGSMPAATYWTTTSATQAALTNSGANTLTPIYSNGVTVSAAGSNVAGITITPSASGAVYQITATIAISLSGGIGQCGLFLTDGTINIASNSLGASNIQNPTVLTGIYIFGSNSAETISIQAAQNVSATVTLNSNVYTPSITWEVVQLPLNIISSVSSSLIGAMVALGVY